MNEQAANDWEEANQRYLTAALAVVRLPLERHIAKSGKERQRESPDEGEVRRGLEQAAAAMPTPPALEILCKTFGLTSFERDLLLLCAGVELDSKFAAICAEAQSDASRPFPTLSLALAALPDAHWSALTPAGPLRHWRLIEVGSGSVLTVSPLRIDERILHYLAGLQVLDERLAGLVEPMREHSQLTGSHQALAQHIAAVWSESQHGTPLPVVQLCGSDAAAKRVIAVAAGALIKLNVAAISGQSLPVGANELDGFLRLWRRESILASCALLLRIDDIDPSDATRAGAINTLIEGLNSPLIISTVTRMRTSHKPVLTFDVKKPSASEQRDLWQRALDAHPVKLNGQVDAIVSQFNLNLHKVQAAFTEAVAKQSPADEHGANDFGKALWDACRMQARPRLDDLAQRIESVATWPEIVLPEQQLRTLREIALHVRQRMTVYETWGFAAKSARGLGISALFVGVSGTGKTMAAEVLANALRLDLYRIDLSAVVSKYIGETEKNLRRVFDAAEEGGAILLFDEADALFGKRSEVKDSHDRYANIEVSYLLQRMEAYRGLAILTTNLKTALDNAFLRRIRFIVHFPFPDVSQREEIWRRIFPAETPTKDLDAGKLARLNVAGGNIRNIALNAAFLAADAGEPVRMKHLLRATQSEYIKLEKSLTDAEVQGWV